MPCRFSQLFLFLLRPSPRIVSQISGIANQGKKLTPLGNNHWLFGQNHKCHRKLLKLCLYPQLYMLFHLLLGLLQNLEGEILVYHKLFCTHLKLF